MNSSKSKSILLLLSVFLIAVSGLIYELLAGTLSSYLLGDSIYHFSIVIGIFMSSMGLGSFLSRFLDTHLAERFILIEVLLGILGGFSPIILFFSFSYLDNYSPFLVMIAMGIGTLIGLEIPLVLRLLKKYSSFKVTVSNVLTADYAGALIASVLFPLIFVPQLGLVQTGLFFGMFNIGVALLGVYLLRDSLDNPTRTMMAVLCGVAVLLLGFGVSENISSTLENRLYYDNVIYTKTTPYQRVVVTRNDDDVRLFINGAIQFSTRDEYRYHEALVHPALSAVKNRSHILVLGGGDGLAIREILKYPDVKEVTLVDIDKNITDFFAHNPLMKKINKGALTDKRVHIVNADAWKFLEQTPKFYQVIIIDLPDPHSYAVSKLYSRSFYRLVARHLARGGAIVTQSTSPLFARQAFWCVNHTLQAVESPWQRDVRLQVIPYHIYIPTFGDWGFQLATTENDFPEQLKLLVPTRYLSPTLWTGMRNFGADADEVETEINTIESHKLVEYYEKGWETWN